MRNILMASTILCVATGSAVAQSAMVPNDQDKHVMFVEYDDAKTVPIIMQFGQETDVTFNPMETVKHVVMAKIGDKKTIDTVDPKDSQIPLVNNVPLIGAAVGDAIVTVLTGTPDGHEQSYILVIHVVPEPKGGGFDDRAMFLVKFRYHAQENRVAVQQAQMTWKDKQAEKQRQIAEARLNVEPTYGPQNYQFYVQTGSSEIAPPRVTDNSHITAFQYPGNTPHPSILFVRDGFQRPSVCDGKKPTPSELKGPEEALNTRVYDDMITVSKTGAHFRLRAGNAVGEVYNCAYDPVGANPGTGTSSPDVYRRVVSSGQ